MNRIPGISGVFFITILALAGCSPFGSISDFAYDNFWVVPQRMTYSLENTDRNVFKPREDLSAFASFQGMTEPIKTEELIFNIFDNDDWTQDIRVNGSNGHYTFHSGGKKDIKVRHGKLTYQYSIEVLDPFAPPPDQEGDVGGPRDPGPWLIWL
jgi:hypothetical protein